MPRVAGNKADRAEACKCLAFWLLFLYFFIEQMGLRHILHSAIDPMRCRREPSLHQQQQRQQHEQHEQHKRHRRFLDAYVPTEASVGYGRLGVHGDLGMEGRCVQVLGQRHVHGFGMHPPAGGAARVSFDFDVPSRTAPAPAPAPAPALATATEPTARRGAFDWGSVELRGTVAINDDNNFFGTAGGDVVFAVLVDGTAVWHSRRIRRHKAPQRVRVLLPPPRAGGSPGRVVHRITLEARAAGSNACAHAVWLDPVLVDNAGRDSNETLRTAQR